MFEPEYLVCAFLSIVKMYIFEKILSKDMKVLKEESSYQSATFTFFSLRAG